MTAKLENYILNKTDASILILFRNDNGNHELNIVFYCGKTIVRLIILFLSYIRLQ